MEIVVVLALCVGFVLDALFGDPHFLWHPVQGIGKLIEWMEKLLFSLFHLSSEREKDKGRKRAAGVILVVVVLLASTGITILLLLAAGKIHPWLKFGLESVICYQMLAMKSLRIESMKVYDAVKNKGLEEARHAVAMIVGRDTQNLTEEGVIRAAVETVAENTSDGVIAPMFYMFLLGPAGGVFYKTVNTMDSMIAYKNDRYCYFGTAAARLDDILNFIPARLAAFLMLAAAFLLGFDVKNAWRVYRRDRHKHASPNSAQTEAVCAGALNVQLAGDACYFGKPVHKPVIGDAGRDIQVQDIKRANDMLYVASFMMMAIGILITAFIRVV
jgi:adenosylcobinamide-phosphate synthase